MEAKIIFILTLNFITSIISAELVYSKNNACKTPNNQLGSCISIRKCPSLLRLIQMKPLKQQSINFLRKSQCGWESINNPKVCCQGNIESIPSPPNVTNNPGLHRLNDFGCGIIQQKNLIPVIRERIIVLAVNSTPAKINEFPWMALLIYDIGECALDFLCGGSIINSRYILTAAHCVTELPQGKRLISVRVGEYDLRTHRDCTSERYCNSKYQQFLIEQVIPHPEFSLTTVHNDIALIRLKGHINFSANNVQTICLPLDPGITIPDKFTVTGWGVYNDRREMSSVLRKVELPRFPQDQCFRIYKKENVDIWHKQICVGGLDGIDGCNGDSGGPLQAQQFYNNSERAVQYGIVSFGLNMCGLPGIPGVYTRVDYYLDWILYNMKD